MKKNILQSQSRLVLWPCGEGVKEKHLGKLDWSIINFGWVFTRWTVLADRY